MMRQLKDYIGLGIRNMERAALRIYCDLLKKVNAVSMNQLL